MDVNVVLLSCVVCFTVLGVEIDQTCKNTNCTQQKRFEGDAPFPCTILNKNGWETFRDKHGLQERYEYRKSTNNFLPPVITAVELYKTIVHGNSISPNINITFSFIERSEIKAILLKFAGFCDGDMADPYYCRHPVYLLFDFTRYRRNILNQHHTRELFYQCIMGLENRGGVSSRWSYTVVLTAFTMKPENPGISITYQLTSYNNKFKTSRVWKPGIMTAVMPGTHDVHVVFERLPPSWVQKNTYYKIFLTNVDDDTHKIITLIKNNSCIFENTDRGTFSVRVIAHKCQWKKTCAVGVSYNFNVLHNFNVTSDKPSIIRSPVTSNSETNKTSGTIIQQRNMTLSASYLQDNHSNTTVVNHWGTYAVIGAISGLILTSFLIFGVCIFSKENTDRINLILACDHHEHREEEKALKLFLQQTLKFHLSAEDIETSYATHNVFMLCEQYEDALVNEGSLKLINNDSESTIFAQRPNRLPYELHRCNCVFEWPVEIEKLLNHLYVKKRRHYYYPWLRFRKMKDYRSTFEYQSLLNTLSYPKVTVDNNATADEKDDNGVNKVLDLDKSKGQYLCPVHGKVNQPLIKSRDLSNRNTHEETLNKLYSQQFEGKAKDRILEIDQKQKERYNSISTHRDQSYGHNSYSDNSMSTHRDQSYGHNSFSDNSMSTHRDQSYGHNSYSDNSMSTHRDQSYGHNSYSDNSMSIHRDQSYGHNSYSDNSMSKHRDQCYGHNSFSHNSISTHRDQRYGHKSFSDDSISTHRGPSYGHNSNSDNFPTTSTDDVCINERINPLEPLKENDPLVHDSSHDSDSSDDIVKKLLEINDIHI